MDGVVNLLRNDETLLKITKNLPYFSVYVGKILQQVNLQDEQHLDLTLTLLPFLHKIQRQYMNSFTFYKMYIKSLLTPILRIMHEVDNVHNVEIVENQIEKRNAVSNEAFFLTVDTLFQPNLKHQYNALFESLFGMTKGKIPPNIEELLLVINSVCLEEPLHVTKLFFSTMLKGACMKYKDKQSDLLKMFVTLCHILRINPKFNQKPLIECGCLPAVPKLEFNKVMKVLNEFVKILVKERIDLNVEVKDISLFKWLQVLTNMFIIRHEENSAVWFDIISSLLSLSPLIVEPSLSPLFNFLFLKDVPSSCKTAYNELFCNLFLIFYRMRRLSKIIHLLLKTGRDSVGEDSVVKLDLPKEILSELGIFIAKLPTSQALDIWTMLLSHANVLTDSEIGKLLFKEFFLLI